MDLVIWIIILFVILFAFIAKSKKTQIPTDLKWLKVKSLDLQDGTRLSNSLSIETKGSNLESILTKGTPVPVTKSQSFSTAVDNQTVIVFKLHESDRKKAIDRECLGEFYVRGVEVAAKHNPKVQVLFRVNEVQQFEIAAFDGRSGVVLEIEKKG